MTVWRDHTREEETVTDAGSKVVEDLVALLRYAKFNVVEVGSARYRITNPDGGDIAFMPRRLRQGQTIKVILKELAKIGFNEEVARTARETERQERLDAERAKGNSALADAERKAKIHQIAAAAKEARETVEELDESPTTTVDVKPSVKIVTLDAELARQLLAANRYYNAKNPGRSNRRFYPRLAQEYASRMARGEWLFTHQGMGMSREGELLDGQHRCEALLIVAQTQPEYSIEVELTYDLPPEARRVLDTGRRRTVSDHLQMEGEVNTLTLAATARLCILYDSEVPASEWRDVWPSADQAIDYLEKFPEVRAAVRLGHVVAQSTKFMLAAGAAAAIHVCAREWPNADLSLFLDGLKTGEDLPAGSPILVLRNFLIRQAQDSKRKRNSMEHMALFVKAWNSWVTGANREVIRLTKAEEFPRVAPNHAAG